MKGVFLKKNNECIERVEKEIEELSLLANGDGVEIMKVKYKENIVFHFEPGNDDNLMEFFYILGGTVIWENEDKQVEIKTGDCFYVHNIKENTYFKTQTEVTLLYISSRPVFHFLSNQIENLSQMNRTVADKDMYTYEHQTRLQDYSVRIGEKLHLTQKELDKLFYSAKFHDIGKVNVPDSILRKPSKLTDEEFECIKKHSIDGEKIIKETFLYESAKAILQHHERLDGSGYPYGLKSEEICIDAKIIAVVDTYDAMTSDRPYRKGMDPAFAINEVKGLIGYHYDKNIVLFLEEILKEDGIL